MQSRMMGFSWGNATKGKKLMSAAPKRNGTLAAFSKLAINAARAATSALL
jgi:hypothetical protein